MMSMVWFCPSAVSDRPEACLVLEGAVGSAMFVLQVSLQDGPVFW